MILCVAPDYCALAKENHDRFGRVLMIQASDQFHAAWINLNANSTVRDATRSHAPVPCYRPDENRWG
jgi:hypothetical protein